MPSSQNRVQAQPGTVLGRDPSTTLCTPLVKVQWGGRGALLAAPSLLWVRLRDRQRSFVAAKGAGAIVLEGIQE